jgi:hypothetical protein
MNLGVNKEMTSSWVGETSSIIDGLNRNNYNNNIANRDGNKEHISMLDPHSWFPYKNMNQVVHLCIDLLF